VREEMMKNNQLEFRWLGFDGFYSRTASGLEFAIDPFIRNNPMFPEECRDVLESVKYIILTHAHKDHAEDASELACKTNATVIAGWELSQLLMERGVENVLPINKGGTRFLDGFSVTAVHADHSGAFVENGKILYGGEPMGFVIHVEGAMTFYHAGDTNVFGDMSLIAELYQPEAAFLPIGDVYTMGPREAAKAIELLKVKTVVPMHFGFDFLTGTPEQLEKSLSDPSIRIHRTKTGEIFTLEGISSSLL
jgi:L-ascorbate metabolism protein UlaG (beta-lactamase superfamily)